MILITGATGYVGRHLVRRLRERGEPLRALARDNRAAQRVQSLGLEAAIGDVTAPESLHRAMEGVNTVIHLVAIIMEKHDTFARNIAQGTRNVVAAAQTAGVTRFLHMSANGAQDNPRYPYLQAKWQAEQAVNGSGLPYTILRPSVIFGEGDQFFNTLATVVRLNPIVPVVGDGKSMFQPIWVEDVCTCFLTMLDDDAYLGKAFDVGGPEQLSYEDLLDIIMRVLGRRKPKLHVPVALMKPLAAVMEKALPNPPVTPAQLDLLELNNITVPNPLPDLFGIAQPAYLQAKLGYIRRA